MIKVYGVSLSPFVRKVLLTLDFKELAYEQVPVTPNARPPGWDTMSPLGKVPVLEHDGFTVPDSSVICRYLDEVFPGRSIYPAEARARARACWIEEYADTRLVETVAPFFFERIVKPIFFKQQPDEARLTAIEREGIPPVLDYVERLVESVPENAFLFGPTLTIADFGLVSPFINGRAGRFVPDADRYPKLTAYLSRALATPLFATRLERETAEMGALTR